ncbi:MAG: H-NS histone family protein [Hyphomicrobiaceae bacterium]|nr:H-NS histone family protein [Hyphomicrobiaceae bacterium]
MASINVDKMSLKDINDLEAKLAKAKAAAKGRAKAEVKEKIDALLEGSGFTIAELYPITRVGRPRGSVAAKSAKSAKYANPDDRSETWTGRGRKPNWLVAKLAKGAALEDFAI